MVVCCHLLQHAPTGTVVCVKSCINSRYPGQMVGWPASSTITLFKFNKIKNSYGPPPILHHRESIRHLCALRWGADPALFSCLMAAGAGSPPQRIAQGRGRSSVGTTVAHAPAAAWQWSPTPRHLSKTCRILSHLFLYIWTPRYFKFLQGTGLLLYRKVLLKVWLFGVAIISSYWITD